MFKTKFYYGDGTDHIVKLTKKQAKAIMGARFRSIAGLGGYLYLPDDVTIEDYNKASDILNEYHSKFGSVAWEDPEKTPMLRAV